MNALYYSNCNIFLDGLGLRERPTECQKQRDDNLNFRGQDLMVKRYVPQCTPDGSYDDVQCSAATGECWCVYYNNIEIEGTRTQGKPSCPPTGKARDIYITFIVLIRVRVSNIIVKSSPGNPVRK